jgi:hypothetical protein
LAKMRRALSKIEEPERVFYRKDTEDTK